MPYSQNRREHSSPTIRDLPSQERPRERLQRYGEQALSTTELLAVIIGSGNADDHALRLAEHLLIAFEDLPGLSHASPQQLTAVRGIGEVKAARIKAAQEFGRRHYSLTSPERMSVTTPGDVATLLMSEMMYLEQEHLRTVLLDTRNKVLRTPTVYIGSLNTTTLRLGEVFRAAIRDNAAAMIICHNHLSGNPSPSPEDINVTRPTNEPRHA